MTALLLVTLAQMFGGYGVHIVGALLSTVFGGVIVAWLNGRTAKGLASDTWLRDQVAKNVERLDKQNAELAQQNADQQRQLDELKEKVATLTAALAAEKAALVTCRGECMRLRRERDDCRESHTALYDEVEKFRQRDAVAAATIRPTADDQAEKP